MGQGSVNCADGAGDPPLLAHPLPPRYSDFHMPRLLFGLPFTLGPWGELLCAEKWEWAPQVSYGVLRGRPSLALMSRALAAGLAS